MKKFILLIISSLTVFAELYAQKGQLLIPMGVEIEVEIIASDTSLLEFYNTYKFKYHSQGGELINAFWTQKDEPFLNPGKHKVKLCRIYRVKTRRGGRVSSEGRGCENYEEWILGYAEPLDDNPGSVPPESAIFLQLCR